MSVALELLENFDINEILKISGFVDESTLEKLIETFQVKDFDGARRIMSSIESLDSRNFIRQLMEILPKIKEINSKNACALQVFLGEIDYRIGQGADEQIQITALLADIIDKINK